MGEPSNWVEEETWRYTKLVLDVVDPGRKGWAIDAGAGVNDFYFEWLHNLGFRTALIEPLPVKAVTERVEAQGIRLFEAALSSKDGTATLHTQADGFLHSLHNELWGATLSETEVQTITWRSIVHSLRAYPPTIAKLDIEGTEPDVIAQFTRMNRPKVLVFEFGGVCKYGDRAGAWSYKNMRRLRKACKHLHSLGYDLAMMFVSGDGGNTRKVSLRRIKFDNRDCWGNIVATLPNVAIREVVWQKYQY